MLEKHKNKCILCSLGCGFIIETVNDEAINLEYDTDDAVGGGALCSKGNYMLELINHPMRLTEPVTDKALLWDTAFETIAEKLKQYAGKSSVGLILEGDASIEDAVTAQNFAETCLGQDCFAVNFATNDDKVSRALANSAFPNPPSKLEDVEKSGCNIAVGDPFEVGPVMAGRILDAKYAHRDNIFGVISKEPNTTSKFAKNSFHGSERKILAGLLRVVADESGGDVPGWKQAVRREFDIPDDPSIINLGKKFVRTPSAVLILETQDPVTAQLASAVVAAAGGDKSLFCLNTYRNSTGICNILKRTSSPEDLIDRAEKGEIEAFIVLGANIVRDIPGRDVKSVLEKSGFLCAGAPFENETTRTADMVLPTALWLETEGTYNGGSLEPVVGLPGGALSYGEILRRLANKMGQTLPPVSPEKVSSSEEMNEDTIHILRKESETDAPEAIFRSTAISYADGSLTGNMSWIKFQERESL